MLSISHTLTGAFIASKLTHPALYIPLTLASHYVSDWIPHRDVGTGLSTGRRKKSTAILLELVELAISFVLLYFFFQHGHDSIHWPIWIAAFVALLPDFLEAPRNLFHWEPAWLKPFNDFHNMFHHSTMNNLVGLGPQVVLVLVIWFLR
jgi:hypothetical protein